MSKQHDNFNDCAENVLVHGGPPLPVFTAYKEDFLRKDLSLGAKGFLGAVIAQTRQHESITGEHIQAVIDHYGKSAEKYVDELVSVGLFHRDETAE